MYGCCQISENELSEARTSWKSFTTRYPADYAMSREERWKDYQHELGDMEIDQIERLVGYNEEDIDAWEWEEFINDFDAALRLVDVHNSEVFAVTSESVGWQELAGGTLFVPKSDWKDRYDQSPALQLIREVLGDMDCSIRLDYERHKDGQLTLGMMVSSHDAPTGNWYDIEPALTECRDCGNVGFLNENFDERLVAQMDPSILMDSTPEGFIICGECMEINDE